ncbi:hypothetical protein FOVSG1_005788 [Fusarium oxysporum f. sp. vasinfectum]
MYWCSWLQSLILDTSFPKIMFRQEHSPRCGILQTIALPPAKTTRRTFPLTATLEGSGTSSHRVLSQSLRS